VFDTVVVQKSNMATVGTGLLLLAAGLILNYVFERHSFYVGDLLYPAFCLLLSLAGVFIAIGGAARASVRRVLPYAYATVFPLTILYFVFYCGMMFLQTGADRLGECPGLDQAATSTNVIPESKSRPGLPAIGCGVERRGMFLSYYNTVGVYGVTETVAQQHVLDSLSEYYRREHTHPIQVRFYEKENWTTRQGRNGVALGFRGLKS
jgi:hypothetical protein